MNFQLVLGGAIDSETESINDAIAWLEEDRLDQADERWVSIDGIAHYVCDDCGHALAERDQYGFAHCERCAHWDSCQC